MSNPTNQPSPESTANGTATRTKFSTLMTLSEAQKALGVLRKVHLERLAHNHAIKHWPTYNWAVRGEPPLMKIRGIPETVVRGDFLAHLERCEDCRPALNAARKEGTQLRAEVSIDGRTAETLNFDEWLDERRAYRIGG